MKRPFSIPVSFIILGVVCTCVQYYSRIASALSISPIATLNNANQPDASHFAGVSHMSLAQIRLSSAALCTDDTSSNCRERLITLQREVVQDYPVPIPQPNVPALITPDEAVIDYKKYLADNAGSPKLIVFKQLYPRILLNKYGILASNNRALIRYFTEHMLEAHSQDFATLAKALLVIRDDVPAGQYNQWLAVTIREAEAWQLTRQKVLTNLKQTIAQVEASPDFEQKKSRRLNLKFAQKQLEVTTIADDLQALRKLQQPVLQ
ncbi:hypothetical protein J2I47_06580 [Fibrella sp. HMF5335]|uniref:Uncharacterized protein n=1 Tax=Fibrella rubiginis TaxID=2817060 RepID=A0A939GBX4_9BACT|nr:hypothetical protein [Fibrella rubiginis]MBO0936207.1 hypothetical protein [Fibrella rubiginis]